MIRPLLAPSAVLRDSSALRPIPRASSRFAIFAHAISRTRPDMIIRSRRLEAYAACNGCMPEPPGVSTTWTFASRVLPLPEEKVWVPANECFTSALSFSRRAVMDTPGKAERAKLFAQGRHGHTGFHASDQIHWDHARREHSPVPAWFDGQKEFRRRARQTVAIEPCRSDSDDGHRFCIDPERAAHHRGFAGIVALPGPVTHHGRYGRARNVIGVAQQSPCVCAQAKRSEIVSGHELTHHRTRTGMVPLAPGDDWPVTKARLHRRQFLEFRCAFL